MSDSNVIKLDKNTVEKIERLHYDYENYKDVIATCLDLHKSDLDDSFLTSPVFLKYQDNMNKAFVAYNIAKGVVEREYDLKNKSWNLDFATCELRIND